MIHKIFMVNELRTTLECLITDLVSIYTMIMGVRFTLDLEHSAVIHLIVLHGYERIHTIILRFINQFSVRFDDMRKRVRPRTRVVYCAHENDGTAPHSGRTMSPLKANTIFITMGHLHVT